MLYEDLVAQALAAKEKGYAPYSGIRVGAAVKTADGSIFTGANVENAAYGLTICAERVAVAKAVTEGFRHIVAVAVAWDGEGFCTPCGACRQVLYEFGPGMRVIMIDAQERYQEEVLAVLLPHAFGV
ncbi:MAG TPA: cytidine deaminase [Desulfotomaculum sp.]|nr:cytidine deaminase [Desulfotomaculum sp.]